MYGEKGNVHHAYMAKRKKRERQQKATKPAVGKQRKPSQAEIDWMAGRIRNWRLYFKERDDKWTQEYVADRLVELVGISYERESYTRIENATLYPPTFIARGIAKVFGTDLETMLECDPAEAEELNAFRRMSPDERKRALSGYRAFRGEGAAE